MSPFAALLLSAATCGLVARSIAQLLEQPVPWVTTAFVVVGLAALMHVAVVTASAAAWLLLRGVRA